MYLIVTLSKAIALDDGLMHSRLACLTDHMAVLPDDEFPELVAMPHVLVKYDNVIAVNYAQAVPTGVRILG